MISRRRVFSLISVAAMLAVSQAKAQTAGIERREDRRDDREDRRDERRGVDDATTGSTAVPRYTMSARRARSCARQADELRGKSRVEILRDRDPIEFLNKRADALTQKATDLKKLAEAWQPLYPTAIRSGGATLRSLRFVN
jgi:hypothetical protein